MEFSKVDNFRAYRAIVDQVCDAILRGDLQTGDYLPSEREVAAQSRLSRSSVRQAYQEMKQAGLVEISVGAGGGTQVISDYVPRELLLNAVQLTRKNLLELSEVRTVVELAAVEFATARATEDQIAELWKIYFEMEAVIRETPNDRLAYERVDINFHQLIMKAARNEILSDIYTSLLTQVIMVVDMVDIGEMHTYGLPTTKKIIEAIEKRSPMDAKIAMTAHISPLAEFIKRYFISEIQA